MTCKLTMTLISEHQEGECGKTGNMTWTSRSFMKACKGEGQVSVPKHNLEPGSVKEPYRLTRAPGRFSGECLTELLVRMQLTATEVDLFVNDVGKASKDIRIECPGPRAEKVTKEVDIAAGVREAPAILNKNSVFTVRVRFTLTCD